MDYVEARYYDPAIGMFRQVDPHFDKYLTIDPFNYGFNNPMMIIDPTGMDGTDSTAITRAAENAVNYIVSTDPPGEQPARCNQGVAHAFEELTGSKELNKKTAKQQIDHMESSDNFEVIENKSEETMEEVQKKVNDGTIVIAGKKEKEGSSHVVLVVPGKLEKSRNWGYNVVHVMDTGVNKRYSYKAISWSWNKADKDGIKFYVYKPKKTLHILIRNGLVKTNYVMQK